METQTLTVTRTQSHDILLGSDILSQGVARLARMGFTKRCAVLTNEVVAKWYLEPLQVELRERGFEITPVILPDGEEQKSLPTAAGIFPKLLEAGLERSCPLIALGGGVIGDLAGFVASTWMRGMPFVNVPTTLLAMVDAGIGGKNGVNLPDGKNLIGTFYQPSLVIIDVATLRTLPLTQLSYGLVEAVKHGAILDAAYFKFLYKNRAAIKEKDLALLQRLVRRSLHIKREVVQADELDKGRRALLNFGHTFGHALETLGEYRRFHHGEAVGLGMLMALRAAHQLDLLREDYTDSLVGLLSDFNLPVRLPAELTPDLLLEAMLRDKKRRRDKLSLVLPVALGQAEITPVTAEELGKLLPVVVADSR